MTTSLPIKPRSLPTITVAIPVYKRLEQLHVALQSVASQDYLYIDLLVSDNGQNGDRVFEIVCAHYDRPFRFRQNTQTVSPTEHWNQLLAEAQGEFFTLLCDDDQISSNFLSELYGLFVRYPQITAAIPQHHAIGTGQQPLWGWDITRPEFLEPAAFIRHWSRDEYGLIGIMLTMLARTADIRACDGFLPYPRGIKCEDALLLKLILMGGGVGLGQTSRFVWQVDSGSMGFTAPGPIVADAVRCYLRTLDTDPQILRFAHQNPRAWSVMKRNLRYEASYNYLAHWRDFLEAQLSFGEWVRAAFCLPFLPNYYQKVFRQIGRRIIRPKK